MKPKSMMGKTLKDGYEDCVIECGKGRVAKKMKGRGYSFYIKRGKSKGPQRSNLNVNDI